jgi:hypothetical protein
MKVEHWLEVIEISVPVDDNMKSVSMATLESVPAVTVPWSSTKDTNQASVELRKDAKDSAVGLTSVIPNM